MHICAHTKASTLKNILKCSGKYLLQIKRISKANWCQYGFVILLICWEFTFVSNNLEKCITATALVSDCIWNIRMSTNHVHIASSLRHSTTHIHSRFYTHSIANYMIFNFSKSVTVIKKQIHCLVIKLFIYLLAYPFIHLLIFVMQEKKSQDTIISLLFSIC